MEKFEVKITCKICGSTQCYIRGNPTEWHPKGFKIVCLNCETEERKI